MADQQWSAQYQEASVSVNHFSGESVCIISSRYRMQASNHVGGLEDALSICALSYEKLGCLELHQLHCNW